MDISCYICLESSGNLHSVCKKCTATGHYRCMKKLMANNINAKCGICRTGKIISKKPKEQIIQNNHPLNKCSLCNDTLQQKDRVPLCTYCNTQCHIKCRKRYIKNDQGMCVDCERIIMPLKIKKKRQFQFVTNQECLKNYKSFCKNMSIFIGKCLFNIFYYLFNLFGIFMILLGSTSMSASPDYPNTFTETYETVGNTYVLNGTACIIFLVAPIAIYSLILFTPFRCKCVNRRGCCMGSHYPSHQYEHCCVCQDRDRHYSSKQHYMIAAAYLGSEILLSILAHPIGSPIVKWLYDQDETFNWKTGLAGTITIYLALFSALLIFTLVCIVRCSYRLCKSNNCFDNINRVECCCKIVTTTEMVEV